MVVGLCVIELKAKEGLIAIINCNKREPIFVTKNGKNSCHQYIGKAGITAFLKAVEMMKNRTKIEAVQQVVHTLELGLGDLVEEANIAFLFEMWNSLLQKKAKNKQQKTN